MASPLSSSPTSGGGASGGGGGASGGSGASAWLSRAREGVSSLAAAASAAAAPADPQAASAALKARCRARALACLDLGRAARGEAFFCEAALLQPLAHGGGDVAAQAQVRRWWVLCLSLGRLQASLGDGGGGGGGGGDGASPPGGAALLRVAAQLLCEFEHYSGGTHTPDALLALAARAGGGGEDVFPVGARGARPGDAVRPALHVCARAGVVYEALLPMAVPFAELSPAAVVTALLDALQALYRGLDAAPAREYAEAPHAAEAFKAMDRRVAAYCVKPVLAMLARGSQAALARALRGAGGGAAAADAGAAGDAGAPPPLLPALLAAGAALRREAADLAGGAGAAVTGS